MKDLIEELQLQVEEAKADPHTELDSKAWGYETGVLISVNEAAAIVDFIEEMAEGIFTQAKKTTEEHCENPMAGPNWEESWEYHLTPEAATALSKLGKL